MLCKPAVKMTAKGLEVCFFPSWPLMDGNASGNIPRTPRSAVSAPPLKNNGPEQETITSMFQEESKEQSQHSEPNTVSQSPDRLTISLVQQHNSTPVPTPMPFSAVALPGDHHAKLTSAIIMNLISALPVPPDDITLVQGPTVDVSKVDESTIDVKVSHSFRAHFKPKFAQPHMALELAPSMDSSRKDADDASTQQMSITLDQTKDELGSPHVGVHTQPHNSVVEALPAGWHEQDGQLRSADGNETTTDQKDHSAAQPSHGNASTPGPLCTALLSPPRKPFYRGAGSVVWQPALDQGLVPLNVLPGSGNSASAQLSLREWELDPAKVLLGRRIAVGGFGEVFVGKYEGTVVAVKRLFLTDVSTVERFIREVQTLARLRHPNLILFMGYCTSPELCIISEYMARGSLYQIIQRGGVPLEPRLQRLAAMSVARGMSYLHTRSPPILHLDLKSPNILVDEKWRIKIADFGLSRVRHHSHVSASLGSSGTPEWMAPEMLRAESYGEPADVYSYGVVLWELLTGHAPWEGFNPMQVVGAVGFAGRELPPPTSGDPFLLGLCTACMSRDPSRRPTFPQIVAALDAQYGGRTLSDVDMQPLAGPQQFPALPAVVIPKVLTLEAAASGERSDVALQGDAPEPAQGRPQQHSAPIDMPLRSNSGSFSRRRKLRSPNGDGSLSPTHRQREGSKSPRLSPMAHVKFRAAPHCMSTSAPATTGTCLEKARHALLVSRLGSPGKPPGPEAPAPKPLFASPFQAMASDPFSTSSLHLVSAPLTQFGQHLNTSGSSMSRETLPLTGPATPPPSIHSLPLQPAEMDDSGNRAQCTLHSAQLGGPWQPHPEHASAALSSWLAGIPAQAPHPQPDPMAPWGQPCAQPAVLTLHSPFAAAAQQPRSFALTLPECDLTSPDVAPMHVDTATDAAAVPSMAQDARGCPYAEWDMQAQLQAQLLQQDYCARKCYRAGRFRVTSYDMEPGRPFSRNCSSLDLPSLSSPLASMTSADILGKDSEPSAAQPGGSSCRTSDAGDSGVDAAYSIVRRGRFTVKSYECVQDALASQCTSPRIVVCQAAAPSTVVPMDTQPAPPQAAPKPAGTDKPPRPNVSRRSSAEQDQAACSATYAAVLGRTPTEPASTAASPTSQPAVPSRPLSPAPDLEQAASLQTVTMQRQYSKGRFEVQEERIQVGPASLPVITSVDSSGEPELLAATEPAPQSTCAPDVAPVPTAPQLVATAATSGPAAAVGEVLQRVSAQLAAPALQLCPAGAELGPQCAESAAAEDMQLDGYTVVQRGRRKGRFTILEEVPVPPPSPRRPCDSTSPPDVTSATARRASDSANLPPLSIRRSSDSANPPAPSARRASESASPDKANAGHDTAVAMDCPASPPPVPALSDTTSCQRKGRFTITQQIPAACAPPVAAAAAPTDAVTAGGVHAVGSIPAAAAEAGSVTPVASQCTSDPGDRPLGGSSSCRRRGRFTITENGPTLAPTQLRFAPENMAVTAAAVPATMSDRLGTRQWLTRTDTAHAPEGPCDPSGVTPMDCQTGPSSFPGVVQIPVAASCGAAQSGVSRLDTALVFEPAQQSRMPGVAQHLKRWSA